MLKLDKVRIRNFYSYKDVTVDFSGYENQIILIKGKNGAGKSTIFEAIIWALFGKTIRKSTEDSLVNSITKRGCVVELWLDGGRVYISRGKRLPHLKFHYEGHELTKSNVHATQAEIEKVLNINYQTMLASMVFGQHNHVDFLSVPAADKRTIIRNFLSLDELFELRDQIKHQKSAHNVTMKAKEAIIGEFTQQIKDLDVDLRRLDREMAEVKYDDPKYKGWTLEKVIDADKDYEYAKGQVLKLSLEEQNLKRLLSDKRLLETVEKGPREVVYNCKTCKQEVVREVTQWEVRKAKKFLRDTEEELSQVLDDLDEFKKVKRPLIKVSEFSAFSQYREMGKDRDRKQVEREKLLKKIEAAERERLDSKRQYDIMRFWERAFSEHGLIKYVIRNILGYLNSQCNHYLSHICSNSFKIVFDSQLNETITMDGQPVHYMSLSGGEKRKLSFCVLLALKSLLTLTGKEQSNLLLVDEVAENLDQEGVDGLLNLLQDLKKTKTIFLITHDKHLKTLLDSCPRISVVKENNFSRIWENDVDITTTNGDLDGV